MSATMAAAASPSLRDTASIAAASVGRIVPIKPSSSIVSRGTALLEMAAATSVASDCCFAPSVAAASRSTCDAAPRTAVRTGIPAESIAGIVATVASAASHARDAALIAVGASGNDQPSSASPIHIGTVPIRPCRARKLVIAVRWAARSVSSVVAP